MVRIPRILYLSIGLITCVLLSAMPASAGARIELNPYSVIEPAYLSPIDVGFLVDVVDHEQHIAIVHRIEADGERPIRSRTVGSFAPEYAESYDTHGLNFIDVRRLC